MRDRPFSVSISLALVLLSAVAWLAFGIVVLAGLHPALPERPLFRQVLGTGSVAAALVLVCLFFFLCKRARRAWFLAVAMMLGTGIATIFDDVGIADLAVIGASFLLAALLIKDRAWYLRREPPSQPAP